MFFGNAEQLRQSEIGRLFPDEEIVEDPGMLGFISQRRARTPARSFGVTKNLGCAMPNGRPPCLAAHEHRIISQQIGTHSAQSRTPAEGH